MSSASFSSALVAAISALYVSISTSVDLRSSDRDDAFLTASDASVVTVASWLCASSSSLWACMSSVASSVLSLAPPFTVSSNCEGC